MLEDAPQGSDSGDNEEDVVYVDQEQMDMLEVMADDEEA